MTSGVRTVGPSAADRSMTSSSAPVARLERVTYRYPNQAGPSLLDVDLAVGQGLIVVAGDSGSGKSTLLRLFDGLVPQFHGGRISGRAVVGGLDPFRAPVAQLAQRAGLVFQDVETQSVYGTVEREIAFGLENLGLPRAVMRSRVDEALAAFGLEALRERRLSTLSGGERQRVQLAAVLVLRPSLVALDEPTSQLDPEGAAAVLEACRDLATGGHAVVVAEHRLETIGPAADLVIRLDAGRATAEAGPIDPPDPPRWHARGVPAARPPAGRTSAPRSAARSTAPRFAPDPAWELRDVSAGPNGGAVLEGLDLAGAGGEVVAVVGPNGSGKTTLLRTIAGLLEPLSGSVRRFEGRPNARTAYLPQNPGALLHLPTVRAEVALTLRRAGTDDSPDELLGSMGLATLADRYPRDLSSGQRQRAALAATIAGSPGLVLLDEPTRGMDAAARRGLAAAVRSLTARGSAVVLATHDVELVAALADRVITLREGRASEPAAWPPEPPAAPPTAAPREAAR
jgi:energy-coupling factor transporter ATP-binding protein EcfA2